MRAFRYATIPSIAYFVLFFNAEARRRRDSAFIRENRDIAVDRSRAFRRLQDRFILVAGTDVKRVRENGASAMACALLSSQRPMD